MDVRCHKCDTLYEFDEARLKPGGARVKCSSCGHVFRIHGPGDFAAADSEDGRAREVAPPRRSSPPWGSRPRTSTRNYEELLVPAAATTTQANEGAAEGDAATAARSRGAPKARTWLIRLEDGTVRSCTQLATLQKWIAAGTVTRQTEISRTGKTWKPLGDIEELNSFFAVVEEVRLGRARAAATGSPVLSGPGENGFSAANGAGGETGKPARLPSASPAPQLSPDAPGATGGPPSWGAAHSSPYALAAGPSGPTGGLARGVSTDDVAFAASAPRVLAGGAAAGDRVALEDDELLLPPRSPLGKWVVLTSLAVIAAAAVVVLLVLRGSLQPAATALPADAAPAVAEPAPPVEAVAAAPPAVDATREAFSGHQALVVEARAAIVADVGEALRALSLRMGEVDRAGEPDLLLERGRIEAALAQEDLDRAEDAEDREVERELLTGARQRGAVAAELARQVLASDGERVAAQVLMADAARLLGRGAGEVRGWLKQARRRDRNNAEATLIEALLLLRHDKVRPARSLLERIDAAAPPESTGDVRVRYRLARLDYQEEKYERARLRAESVAALQPQHRAAHLVSEIAAAAGGGVDPMPPEIEEEIARSGERGYEVLLQRADKKAETGGCGEAMALYQRALDLDPGGVAALTGLGYCHIDKGEFVRAQDKFRAALGISPRYQEALLGIAEAYQQQGQIDKAVAAYRRYVEEHPHSARAAQAWKQIEQLERSQGRGDSARGSAAGGESVPAEPAPTPAAGQEGTKPTAEPEKAPLPAPSAPSSDPGPS